MNKKMQIQKLKDAKSHLSKGFDLVAEICLENEAPEGNDIYNALSQFLENFMEQDPFMVLDFTINDLKNLKK
jgi:hypothetical protein